MKVRTGLDALIGDGFGPVRGKRVSIVCNQATIAADLTHILDHFRRGQEGKDFSITAALGPQHGLWGHTQDNMIEWEGAVDHRFGFPIYSLYGSHREPTDEMLADTDILVIDLPDIGSRYYTFIWSMALCLKACESKCIPVLLLDRPNPIGGTQVEGTVLDPEYASFVGLHPLPIRHGMTLGEIAKYLQESFYPNVVLEIVKIEGWTRGECFHETGLPWAMPSPNIPAVATAIVYPGGCLLEGTALSEGRGTTRPFETFGAPYIDGWALSDALNNIHLGGVHFRPVQFQPTFQKHAGSICEGAFVHVTDRASFNPFISYVAILQEVIRQYPDRFEWKSPPYEYEYTRLPIDILAGNEWLRASIENLEMLERIEERTLGEVACFAPMRGESLLY